MTRRSPLLARRNRIFSGLRPPPPFVLALTIFVSATLLRTALATAASSATRDLADSDDKCAASSSFACPNCGGIQVSDCSKCENYLFTDFNHGICYDRKLFNSANHEEGDHDDHYPFLWNDIVASFFWFLTAGIATACGVGGGGIYVPMGIILLRFPPKPASGLSQASIFGASLGGLLVNIRNSHPDKFIRDTLGQSAGGDEPARIVPFENGMSAVETETDRQRYLDGGDGKRKFYKRPVIDYDMALFLAPMEMAGAVLGVIVQKLFPNWLFLSLAAVILGFTSYKTFKKFFAAYAKDKVVRRASMAAESEAAAAAAAAVLNGAETNGDTDDAEKAEQANGGDTEDDGDDIKSLELRRQYLEEDSRQFPKEKLAYLAILWIGLTVITFIKGGKGVESVIGITCEDVGFYIVIASQFFWTLGFAAYFGWKNMKRTEERKAVNYPFNENDPLWDFQKVRFYAFYTFVAGVVAGLIGIGGGMVLGPLMLVMGIHPSVSTATTATMIVMTSSSVAIIFVMSGLVPWQYAVYFFSICLCGAYIGKTRIDSYVKKTGMSSVLIGVLAAIIAFATVGCVVIMLLNLSKVDWCIDGFKEFCTASGSDGGCEAARRLTEAHELFPF